MAAAHALTDHEQVRRWADARGGKPACVKGTGRKGDTGMIRLDFPGFSGGQSLQPISWDEWFRSFDDNQLALLVQDKTARGQQSNFNKLVARRTAAGQQRSRRASGGSRAGRSSARSQGSRRTASPRTTHGKSRQTARRSSVKERHAAAESGTRTRSTPRASTARSASGRTSRASRSRKP